MIKHFRGKYGFLSNMHHAPFTYKGVQFPTVEHAYFLMSICDDSIWWEEVIKEYPDPVEVRAYCKRFTRRPNWHNMKLRVMKSIVMEKFQQNPHLMEKLKATGNMEIVEGNTWNDQFWGQCPLGEGRNELGKIIMEIRDENTVDIFF